MADSIKSFIFASKKINMKNRIFTSVIALSLFFSLSDILVSCEESPVNLEPTHNSGSENNSNSGSIPQQQDPQLSVNLSSLSFSAEGGDKTFKVNSNETYKAETKSKWFRISQQTDDWTVRADANSDRSSREDSIVVTSASGLRQVVLVSQEGKPIAVSGKENGHEYVDLGLPSGVLWATCNVGANTPEEFGDYYAWGETSPYYTTGYSQDISGSHWRSGKSQGYAWSSYTWCKGTEETMTKYCTNNRYGTVDNLKVLEPEDDAAHVLWKGRWHIPTKEELDELCSECTWEEERQLGVRGYLFHSTKNGNTLFLPCAGYHVDKSFMYGGLAFYYWSSTVSTTNYRAEELYIAGSNHYINGGYRYRGYPIRPVFSK